jgi:hypothetical protein
MTDVEFANFLHQVFGHLSASCHDGATETDASHTNITPYRYGLTRVFCILPPAPRTLVRVPCVSLPDIPTVSAKAFAVTRPAFGSASASQATHYHRRATRPPLCSTSKTSDPDVARCAAS